MNLRMKMDEFWPIFLSTHLNRTNRIAHLVGNAFFFGCLAAAFLGETWILLPVSFLGYSMSWFGHFYFEKNRPATFRSPFISGLCDLKMIGLMLSGELNDEIHRLFGSPAPRPGSPILVTTQEELVYQSALRTRISEKIKTHPFTRYWDIFLLKHQNPWNVWAHVVAMIYLYGLVGYIVISAEWKLLFLVPLAQGIGLISHALCERTHIDFGDAIFSMRAFGSLNRMVVLVLTGKYWSELRRAQLTLQNWQDGQRL